MLRHRALLTAALSASLVFAAAVPARAGDVKMVQKKSFSSGEASGKVKRYEERRSEGKERNWVDVAAHDEPGGQCTEVWWDYATKPHLHFNPGVVVNCSGKSVWISKLHLTDYYGIAGMQVIVCEVPKTSGRIYRNSSNCRGNLGGMYLYSGKSYSQFAVKAIRFPNGVRVYWP